MRATRVDEDASDRGAPWDGPAFEALFRAHYAGLCGFVQRIVRSPEMAEELVQDVFATLWAQRRSLRIQTSVKAYLYRAARNRALNAVEHDALARAWAERQAADDTSPGSPDAWPAQPPPADAALTAAELQALLARLLAALPPRCREVMRLRYLEQMSHAEIAEALDISLKGVENHLSRGLASLRRLVSRESL